ncbi:hypothetical protein B0H14DRAFT_2588270 [Mycena olivaceomarginata]|nr:hypothetical protein B0H14DRAFT_2588270 [Mycena olivaceomarginata]
MTRITVASHGLPDSSLLFPVHVQTSTSSPTRPDKCNLSMRTPTKRQILEEDSILPSPSTARIAVSSHQSPGTSLPMKSHFRLPTDSATTPPDIRTFAIADVSIFTASESTPPTSASQVRCTNFSSIQPACQPQSIHYPGFDVFVDAARTVRLNALMDKAFDAQITNISAAGSDQDEEKENMGEVSSAPTGYPANGRKCRPQQNSSTLKSRIYRPLGPIRTRRRRIWVRYPPSRLDTRQTDGNVDRSRTLVPRFITKRTAVYMLGVARTGRRATGVVDQAMQTSKNEIEVQTGD